MYALVCEDDPSIRKLVQTIARREGFDVDVVEDGGAAIEQMENRCYDLVVLDLMMPGIDGRRVVERVRERWPERVPRIVVMTAASEQLAGTLAAPVCTVLPKPFDIDKLAAVVHDCARGRGQA